MGTDHNLIIVIPVYNEEKRIDVNRYANFLKLKKEVGICFVNDGSRDKTMEVLTKIRNMASENVIILEQPNGGKAAAVFNGFAYCLKHVSFDKIGYLDADLATPLEEFQRISEKINQTTEFAFGSRIAKLDCMIKRKFHRFIIGRFVATLISKQLDLKVYDTQCGCKVFSKKLAAAVFKKSFVSTWLFDVEIFHRILHLYGKKTTLEKVKEVPLKQWIDTDASKVSPFYFFKMLHEFSKIHKNNRLEGQLKIIPEKAI